MSGEQIQILISMAIYMAAVIGIGIYYYKRANKSSENYFLGGRSFGPYVTAMSAEASDMSGWLLMGLPGLAYWCGLADAMWTAIGLIIGTYLNWLIVSKRLRRYSVQAKNSITIPDFFSNRFREKDNSKIIMSIAAIFILVFFTFYTSSCFAACGKLFASLFNAPYEAMVIIGAVFVIAYTLIGGFLAESASDFMQSIVMIVALSVIVIIGFAQAGGVGAVFENASKIDGFLDFFGIATPETQEVMVNGSSVDQQVVENGVPLFGAATPLSFIGILSALAWGLGYFGMPQVLLKFMGIRKESELKVSRRVAMVWVVISLGIAVLIGIIGRQIFPAEFVTKADAENIFIKLSTSFLPPLIAGLVMAGILAATISSSDSYLLIAASSVSKNIFQGIIKKNATDKQVMWVSRITLVAIAVIAAVLVMDKKSIIFDIVSFAWAGFGATFGPLMLFSLFWKRTNRAGAVSGMLGGGCMVFAWWGIREILKINNITGTIFDLYELLPAFIFSSILIVVVSLLTKKPSAEIEADFDAVASGNVCEVASEA